MSVPCRNRQPSSSSSSIFLPLPVLLLLLFVSSFCLLAPSASSALLPKESPMIVAAAEAEEAAGGGGDIEAAQQGEGRKCEIKVHIVKQVRGECVRLFGGKPACQSAEYVDPENDQCRDEETIFV